MSTEQLPINTLVSNRCEELGLRPVELVRRCGYKNISKGLRRLEQLRRTLPYALDVPAEEVTKAVQDTQREIHEAEESAWRASFIAHALIITERQIPTQIFVAAFIGIDRLRRVDFDLEQGPVS